jgi:hypothetical protein
MFFDIRSYSKTKFAILMSAILLVMLIFLYLAMVFIGKKTNSKSMVTPPTITNQIPITLSDIDSPPINIDYTPIPKLPSDDIFPLESSGGDLEIPEYMEVSGLQREELMKKTPINTVNFTIDFDYKSSLFSVFFLDEKNVNNNVIFEEWLSQNYPNLDLADFQFAN